MCNKMIKLKEERIAIFVLVFLALISLATHYSGSTDTGDYADSAKYFAGKYSADVRNSHSYLFGYLHYPFIKFFDSFIIFKITSILFLILIIVSVYHMTNSRKAFWLMCLSPAVWYMAPWINPIQLASLILLWAFYFVSLYEQDKGIKNLIYSGILIGLGIGIWNTMLFMGIIFGLVFLIDKKLVNSIYFSLSVLIGLIPLFWIDWTLFGFPFYTLIKTTMSNFIATLFGGIYGAESGSFGIKIFRIFLIFLCIPLYFWTLYNKRYFQENKKSLIFVSLTLILIISNAQLRYIIALIPIMVILTSEFIDEKQFKRQIILSLIISLVFIIPYIFQIGFSLSNDPFGVDVQNVATLNGIGIYTGFADNGLVDSINEITKTVPNQTFLVGNAPDDYQMLAHFYWGNKVKEFVSIQDYDLWKNNQSTIFEKSFSPSPRIEERRQIFFVGGIKKSADDTDFADIQYAIGIDGPIEADEFELLQRFDRLYLSKKIDKNND